MFFARPSLTPYNFVQNNPIMLMDPTGLLDNGGGDPPTKDGNCMLDEVSVTAIGRSFPIKDMWPSEGGENELGSTPVMASLQGTGAIMDATSALVVDILEEGIYVNPEIVHAASVATAGILVDDPSGVGVLDDPLILLAWLGAGSAVMTEYMQQSTQLYHLVALETRMYPVMKFGQETPNGEIMLQAGEVWKLGTTSQFKANGEQNRYSEKWLKKMGLRFVRIGPPGPRAQILFEEWLQLYFRRQQTGRLYPGNKKLG